MDQARSGQTARQKARPGRRPACTRSFCAPMLRDLASGTLPTTFRKIASPVLGRRVRPHPRCFDSRLRQLAADDKLATPVVGTRGEAFLLRSPTSTRSARTSTRSTGPDAVIYRVARKGSISRSVACVNFKGGSGKTTTAAHLAQSLVLRGYRVLALDLEPQASHSALFGVQPRARTCRYRTIYDAIRYGDEKLGDAGRHPAGRTSPASISCRRFSRLDVFEFEAPLAAVRRRTDDPEPPFFARMSLALEEVEEPLRRRRDRLPSPPRLPHHRGPLHGDGGAGHHPIRRCSTSRRCSSS